MKLECSSLRDLLQKGVIGMVISFFVNLMLQDFETGEIMKCKALLADQTQSMPQRDNAPCFLILLGDSRVETK